jgi:hypothetical protein
MVDAQLESEDEYVKGAEGGHVPLTILFDVFQTVTPYDIELRKNAAVKVLGETARNGVFGQPESNVLHTA